MFIKTKAIVLQTIKFSENSVIAKLFTQDLGLISFVVKGVRSAKNQQKNALFQPMTFLQIDFNFQQNKNLHYIREYKRDFIFSTIPFEMPKIAIGLFLIEVIGKIVREQETNHELFDLIYDSFQHIDTTATLSPDFHLLFLIQLSNILGFEPHEPHNATEKYFHLMEGRFYPENNSHPNFLSAKESKQLLQLLQTNLFQSLQEKISRADRKILLEKLLHYFQLHLENFHHLKSVEVLESVFEGQ